MTNTSHDTLLQHWSLTMNGGRCLVPACGQRAYSYGLCRPHFARFNRHLLKAPPVPERKVCSVTGCRRPAQARGFCMKHYTNWKRHGTAVLSTRRKPYARYAGERCQVEGCNKWAQAKGLCAMHYGRVRRTGQLEKLRDWSAYDEQIMETIARQLDSVGYAPTMAEVAESVGLTPGQAQSRVEVLIARGRLYRDACVKGHSWRNLRIRGGE